jgi:hypothetical protein
MVEADDLALSHTLLLLMLFVDSSMFRVLSDKK